MYASLTISACGKDFTAVYGYFTVGSVYIEDDN